MKGNGLMQVNSFSLPKTVMLRTTSVMPRGTQNSLSMKAKAVWAATVSKPSAKPSMPRAVHIRNNTVDMIFAPTAAIAIGRL